METKRTGNKHRGQLVKRFRESIGMKQSTLADELGTTQQNISYYEKQEELDDTIFADLAKAMGVNPQVLEDFVVDSQTFNIQEMKDHSAIYNFNPIDKILEQSAKIEQLYKELLESERNKIQILTNANEALQKTLKG